MGSTVAPRMGTVAWPKRSSNSDRDAPVGIVDLDNAGLKQANAENQIRRRHGQYRRATYGNSRVAKAQFEFTRSRHDLLPVNPLYAHFVGQIQVDARPLDQLA